VAFRLQKDRHLVPPDGLQLVAVADPLSAVHLAKAIERPSNLVLRVDHVAPGAQGLGLGDLCDENSPPRCSTRNPVCRSKVAT
jgi:hypothetical protein